MLENLRQEEIGTIAEGMDEIIYVSDVETYELYYMNAQGRKITGIYDYKGRKRRPGSPRQGKPLRVLHQRKALQKQISRVGSRNNAFLGSRRF